VGVCRRTLLNLCALNWLSGVTAATANVGFLYVVYLMTLSPAVNIKGLLLKCRNTEYLVGNGVEGNIHCLI
jgi:hypothetical protein